MGRWFANIEDYIDATIQGLEECTKKEQRKTYQIVMIIIIITAASRKMAT